MLQAINDTVVKMLSSSDFLQFHFLENPFMRYSDTRFFYPNLAEQRKVLEVAHGFIGDQKDPSKNLGVIAGPSGGGKSMLAMKLAETHFAYESRGNVFGLYMNTNTLTEPRHFLMAVIETLSLPSSRSNANRIESIFDRLEDSDDQLLIVLDGPPFDQDYLMQMLGWSVEHNKKIKTIIFLQDINNNTSNIGSLNQFLGLYVPFRAPDAVETASLMFARMMSAGHPDPLKLIPQETMLSLAEQSRGSLSEALRLGNDYLEKLLEEQKGSLRLGLLPFRPGAAT